MDSLAECEVSIQRVVNSHLDKDVLLSASDRSMFRMILWNFVVKILTSSREDEEKLLLAARLRCGRSCCVAMRELIKSCKDTQQREMLDVFCMQAMLQIRAGSHRDCREILNSAKQIVPEADSYFNYCSVQFLCALYDQNDNNAPAFLRTLLLCNDEKDETSRRLVALARCAIDLNRYESALTCCEHVLSNDVNDDSIQIRLLPVLYEMLLRDVVDDVQFVTQCFRALNRIRVSELEWSPKILYRCWQLLSMPNFFSLPRDRMEMYDLTLRSIETLLPSRSLSRDRIELRVRMLLCADLVRGAVVMDEKSHQSIINHIEICNEALERIRENQEDNDDDITRLKTSELKRCNERMVLFTFFGRARGGHIEPVRLFEDLKRTLNNVPTTWYVLEHLAVSMLDVKYNHIRQYLLREALKNLCSSEDKGVGDDQQQNTIERLLVRLLDCSTSESVLDAYRVIASRMGFVRDVPFDSYEDPCFKNFSVSFCEYIASEAFNDTIEPLSKRFRSSDVQTIREYLLFFLHVCDSLRH